MLSAFLLLFFNGQAFAGDTVKIVINKKLNKLAYLENGEVVKVFPVATGRQASYTPEGTFKVVKKLVKPAYNKLKIPGGSPRNPLGVRWLGLDALGTSGGTYGIHGTNNPRSIGRYASAGCVRMQNSDVIWLYDHVPLNTTVEIINRSWDLEIKPVYLSINNSKIDFSSQAKPYLAGDTAMVPCRLVAQQMGLTVEWSPELKQVRLHNGQNAFSATVGSVAVYHNGIMSIMNTPAVIKNNVLYLPARYLAEAFGWKTSWDNEKLLLSING